MSDIGYLKLFRQIQNNYLWDDKPFAKGQAWIDLLILTNFRDGKMLLGNELRTIGRGSFHTSLPKLADRWGWNKKTVSRFLDLLESDGMLSQKRDTKGITLTIVKYEDFQKEGSADGTAVRTADGMSSGTHCGTQSNRTVDTIEERKNIKESKEGKNNIPPLSPRGGKQKTIQSILHERDFSEPVTEILEQWLKYKIEKKQGYTETGLNQLLNKIERYANDYGDAKVVDVISRTMAANYQGIVYEWFEDRERGSGQRKQTENFYERLRRAVNEC